jgi:hypothetical protein
MRRLGQRDGGRLGMKTFMAETGIPEKQILGAHFANWNEAIVAAGLTPQVFAREKADEAATVELLAQFVQRLGHWPTENELSLERRRTVSTSEPFPSLKVIRRINRSSGLGKIVTAHCRERTDLALAATIAAKRAETEPTESPSPTVPIIGYVYMMRSGRRYKIGRSNDPARRYREVRLDLPDPTERVHAIATDDPPGIEAYWHQRFAAKRVRNTEFFTLDASDVAAFKRRKFQ